MTRMARRAGKPVVIAPLATLAGTKLAYVYRGAKTNKAYGEYFPSINAAYNITADLIARASFAKSIARPDFSTILPSISIPDETSTSKIITIANPNLSPWTANSYGVSLEYYFNQRASGVISARAYRRDIANFWGAINQPITDDVLASYGLDATIYGASRGYTMTTTTNVGAARISGLEFDYRQNLTFFPHWARGLSVFANSTMQHMEGPTVADFSGFVAKIVNFGIALNRSQFTGRVNINMRGRERQTIFTGAGVESGTYTYKNPRDYIDITTEYRVFRRLSLFANIRNLLRVYDDTTLRYGPSTPDYAKISLRQDFGALVTAGIKGTF